MAQEDIVKMARKAGIAKYGLGWTCWEGQLEAFAALVAAAEREACAKVCDVLAVHPEYASDITKVAAQAIRARGNSETHR
jgi:hypothetical protein